MPYIKPEQRAELDKHIIRLTSIINFHASHGAMNYTITKLIHGYLKIHGLNYVNINAMIGILECAKLELYRMIAVPYEN